ncbi:serine/threonine protein kinase [Gigaspora margarita]|uniref:Serine/threonine protein kinase n=1 Tax=Gigaspora margarita TaxID=4874 RepID=A0A8H4AKF5_GIGMA|nr:serine/threonine protein kinase [Gigaspora margarita]
MNMEKNELPIILFSFSGIVQATSKNKFEKDFIRYFLPCIVLICPRTNIYWLLYPTCPICKKNRTHIAWCQECGTKYFKENFDNWTSGNQKIDEIIKETQLNSKFAIDFVEWIPYEQFEQIEEINRGGFGTIYSAVWKQVHFLLMHIKCCTTSNLYANSLTGHKIGRSPILRCYGLTKRPISENNAEYMLVIQFAKGGDLKTYLSANFKQMKWLEDKQPILTHIAYGLKIIHKEEFKASDKILLSQNTQVVELPTIQNTQYVEPPMMQNTFDTSHSLIDTSGFPVFRFRYNKLENRRLVIKNYSLRLD